MKTFNIYLSGGMTGMSMSFQYDWRVRIRNKLELCSESKYKVECFNPVDYYSNTRPEEYDSEREVMEFDLHNLRQTDLIIVNFNNPKSLGTMAEIAIAYDRRIPIIGLYEGQKEDLHPWQQDMCNRILGSESELVEYIEMYYLT